MLVPPHFFVSTAFKKMRWKDEFRKWLPKLPINWFAVTCQGSTRSELPCGLLALCQWTLGSERYRYVIA